MLRGALVVLVASCAGRSPPPKRTPPPPDRCDHVADHLLSLLSETAKEAPTEVLDNVRASFATHCRHDGWSAEAQECFLSLPAKAEVDRCANVLTESQRAALEAPPEHATGPK